MGLITEKIDFKISPSNYKYFKNKYDIRVGDIITINVYELPPSSIKEVIVECDICSKRKSLKWLKYKKNITKHNIYSCSEKCSKSKKEMTCIEKYSVSHISQNDNVKNKIKESKKIRYGDSNYNNNEKYKKTCIEKYGVDNIFKNVEFIEKNKELNKSNHEKRKNDYFVMIKNKVDSEEYEYINRDVINNTITLKHKICGNVTTIKYDTLFNRLKNNFSVCFDCEPKNSKISMLETHVGSFLKNIGVEYIESNRDILNGQELDIYIPEHSLAIEFNGVYWHSEKFKDKEYHLEKSIKCQEKGIQLLHIFEDDWNYKRPIIESIIRNKLGKISNRIYARKCIIKEVKSNITRDFLDTNHIQGFSRSKYKLGLYYDNELVSLMTFGYRKTNSKKEFELIRFCNKLNTNVIGASSKLFKHFLNNYSIEESYILSYADISLFDGKMYDTLGFDEIHLTKPNYYWVVNGIREHRFKYNKQKLIKEGYDASKTEVEIMHSRGHYRIYGAGQKRYEYKLK